MKKRLLSILTLLTMAVSLISPVVLAQDGLNENTDNQTESVEEAAQEEGINDDELESSEAKDKELEKEAVVKLRDLAIHDKDGNKIKKDNELIMKDDEELEIKAEGSASKEYQWQILNPESTEEKDKWIDIQDEIEETLKLSYALIKNLLVEDATKIRVRSADDKDHFSEFIKVKTVRTETMKLNDIEKESISDSTFNLQNESKSENNIVTIVYEVIGSAAEKPIKEPYIAALNNEELTDNPFREDVKSPEITGYTPTKIEIPDGFNLDDIFDGGFDFNEADEIRFNIKKLSIDLTIKVIYEPADVGFTVRHHEQNIENDKYTLVEEEKKDGFTGDSVNDKYGSLKKDKKGFYSLTYPIEEIAADGKTVIDIYYDREYFLMSFDLQGGFGVEPIYAKYGAPIKIDETKLQRPGYRFDGWEGKIPETMPAEDTARDAIWTAEEVGYTVVYWYENADDDDYSYAGQDNKRALPETIAYSRDYTNFKGQDHQHFQHNPSKNQKVTIKADGTSIVNVYFNRKSYELKFFDGGNLRDTITAKYNEYIADEFPIPGYDGRAWEATTTNPYAYALQTLDRMPGQNVNFNLYNKSSNNEKRIDYYVESVNGNGTELLKSVNTYFNFITYEEEYHPIQGFTRRSLSQAGFDRNGEKDFDKERKGGWLFGYYSAVELEYTRNSYNLRFNSLGENIKTELMKYEASFSKHQNYEPAYPENLEADAYEFAGWYKSPVFDEDTKVKFDKDIMPAADMTLYAKWIEKEHDVKFYNSQNESGLGKPLQTYRILHNGMLEEKSPEPIPEDESFIFIGWFYSDNGNEKAFDPENMSVTKPLNLYPKWRSDKLVDYEVRYVLRDTEREVAPSMKGQALAGSSKTFEARFGNDLYGEYRDGFYPEISSQALELKLDNEANILTFYYEEVEDVEYTVRYLDKNRQPLIKIDPNHPGRLFYRDSEGKYYYYKDGKKEFADFDGNLQEYIKEKTTRKSVITEEFERITGYLPDYFYKRKVLTSDKEKNEIIFYYEQSKEVPVTFKYFKQNIDGNGYTEVESDRKTEIVPYDSKQPKIVNPSSERKDYTGYDFIRLTGFDGEELEIDKDVPITERGLELNYYYNRDTVNLTIKKITDDQYSSNDKFLFNVNGDDIDMTVTVSGNEEVTITDLPAGMYTITEDTTWSWRYEAKTDPISRNITSDETLVFENNLSKNNWLTDEQSKENIFNQRGGE